MRWDYVIVGAGSAGCALAFALAHDAPGARILILEAGGSDRSAWIRLPAGQLRALAKFDWDYRSQPDPSRSGATERWRCGRVLGGSSSINGTLYARGATRDYERWSKGWRAEHAARWSAESIMEMFRDFERSDQPGERRGRSGPLHVRTVRRPHSVTAAFVAAAQACGHPFNADYNGESQEGIAYAQLSQLRGMRCSAADAFLKPLLGRSNVSLLLNAAVRKIEIEDGRATGVCFERRGSLQRVTARDVIVCAGALNSPKLLMLSGIGDAHELRNHGIELVLERAEVGCNLKEHPLLRMTYATNVLTYNQTEGLSQRLAAARRFLASGEGPIANLFEAVAFLRSDSLEPMPDIQLHFLAIGCRPGPDGTLEFAPYPSVTVLLNKSYPLSSGRVRLGDEPGSAPRVECRLLQNDADVRTLVKGIEVVRTIMRTAPMRAIVREEIAPGEAVEGPQALAQYVVRSTGISFHPVGTCRMGTDEQAVVGPDLRVRGMENLWIADASIMPDTISGNTNATCMMIGLKLGRELAARLSS